MTYANHRNTEVTEASRRFFGVSKKDLCAFSVASVSLWLAYVI